MKLERRHLQDAENAGIITQEQAELLWKFWQGDEEALFQGDDGSSPMSKFLYYFGTMIVISGMGWLMNQVWESFHGAGLFAVAAGYAAIFVWASHRLRHRAVVVSGLLLVMAVCMTPLAVFGLEKWWGIWPKADPSKYRDFFHYIRGGWCAMEVATLAAGILAMRWSRIPFAMAPVALVLWWMSMDATPLLFPEHSWKVHELVSLCNGLFMLAVAFAMDRRTKVDYAKWMYIFGMMSFWAGLSLLDSGSEWGKFFYGLINVLLMLIGVLIERKVFLVFGSVGFFAYLGHLAWTVCKNWLLFPPILTLLGLGVVYLGWLYHKKGDRVEAAIRKAMPGWMMSLLPQNRKSM